MRRCARKFTSEATSGVSLNALIPSHEARGIYFSTWVCYTFPWSCSSPALCITEYCFIWKRPLRSGLCRHRTAPKSDCIHLHDRSFIFSIQTPFSPETEGKREETASHWNGKSAENVSLWGGFGRIFAFCVCMFLKYWKKALQISWNYVILLKLNHFQTWGRNIHCTFCIFLQVKTLVRSTASVTTLPTNCSWDWCKAPLSISVLTLLPSPGKYSSPGHPLSARLSKPHQTKFNIII